MPPTEQETAGPIERYLIHRANEAAVAAKPSMWDNLLRDLLPKSTPAAKAATKLQAHARAAKARRLSAAAAVERTAEVAAVEAKSLEARRIEAAAAVKAHDIATHLHLHLLHLLHHHPHFHRLHLHLHQAHDIAEAKAKVHP